jgi:hypothetical protein
MSEFKIIVTKKWDLPVRFCNMCFCNKCSKKRINYITNHQTTYENLEKNKFFFLKRELRSFLLQHTFVSVG